MGKRGESQWPSWLVFNYDEWAKVLSHRCLGICLAVGLIASVIMVARPPFIYQLLWDQELPVQDHFFAWRSALMPPQRTAASEEIVIISIDNESARRLGNNPPWPRKLYAKLLNKLRAAGAKTVAFDIMFEGPSPLGSDPSAASMSQGGNATPEARAQAALADDSALAQEFKKSDNVVLATNVELSLNLFHGRSQIYFHTPYPQFIKALGADSSSLGNVVVEPDNDGVVRRAALIFDNFPHMGGFFHAFGLRVAEKQFGTRSIASGQGPVWLNQRYYPRNFRINYAGPPGTVLSIPFWKALDWEKHYGSQATGPPANESNPFAGKTVLVGYHDYPGGEPRWHASMSRSLPFNSFLTPLSGFSRPMSGVEVQANILSNIYNARFLAEPEWWENFLLLMLTALFFGRVFAALSGRPWSMLACVLAFSAIWLALGFGAFLYGGCLIPVVVPILGVAFPAWFLVIADQNFFIFRDRRRRTRVFRELAGRNLAEEIDRRKLGELGLEGKRVVVTTLVCQIKEMNELASATAPDTAIELYNRCLGLMVGAVYEHSGIVYRIWSDGISALWGAPIEIQSNSQARLAAGCFIDIQERLSKLAHELHGGGHYRSFSAELTCGINTGEAVCGRIGSQNHAEYGAIGQSVQLTGRLEQLNERYGTRCLVGETTAGQILEQFELRELDKVKAGNAGREETVYELLCKKGKLPGAVEEGIALFRQAVSAMDEGNLEEAERIFISVLRIMPEDKPTQLLLERCRDELSRVREASRDSATLVAHE